MLNLLLLIVILGMITASTYLYRQLQEVREESAINKTRLQEQLKQSNQEVQRIQNHLNQYTGIIDKEVHEQKLADKISQLKRDISQLSKQKTTLEEIVKVLEEEDNLHAIAFYQPKHSFDDSSEYQSRLEIIRDSKNSL